MVSDLGTARCAVLALSRGGSLLNLALDTAKGLGSGGEEDELRLDERREVLERLGLGCQHGSFVILTFSSTAFINPMAVSVA